MSLVVVIAARFTPFSPLHWGLVATCLLGVVAILALVRGDSPRLRRGLAVLIPVFTVPLQLLQLLPGDFTVATSLPLQVCDLAWVLAVYALWTRRAWASTTLYLWGLTLVPQAVLTPSLQQDWPDPRFVMFWGMHLLIVWAAAYLVASGGRALGPTWRDYRVAVLVTAAWAAAVMALNAVLGTNYGYLNRKPSASSALDLLGPWPAYVVVEVVVVAAVWALMTWPFTRCTPPATTG